MKYAQIYATADQIMQDMDTEDKGKLTGISDRIKEASKAIQGKFGTFIPVEETRTFTADYHIHHNEALNISPILEVLSVKVNGSTITEYTLEPGQRHWANGPYSMIQREHGFHSGDVIEISGLWGMYADLATLDLSVSQATDSETTLTVENGGLLSPGMVLLIDDEQEFITCGNGSKGSPAPTEATSLLDGDVDEIKSEQILTVDNGSEFFEGEVLRCDSEDIYIERISGNDLTVQRGWNDTIVSIHADNAKLYVYRTYKVVRGVNGSVAAAHSEVVVQQYLVPDDLNWLCRQITGLMIMKAKSGFQGRVGSSETGESMYFSEFPPNQIAFIKSNYSI